MERRIRALESRRARLKTRAGRASSSGDVSTAMAAPAEARLHAAQARQRLRESLISSARAHERAAAAHTRAAEHGGMGVAEHRAAAAQHRRGRPRERCQIVITKTPSPLWNQA
ncbi:hypothetical protein ACVDFE_28205 [Lentzea chajnantorensis]